MLRRTGDFIVAFVRGFVLFMKIILGGAFMTYILLITVCNGEFWSSVGRFSVGFIKFLPTLVLYAIPGLAVGLLLGLMFGPQEQTPSVHRGRKFGSRSDAQKELRQILNRQRSKRRDRRSRLVRMWDGFRNLLARFFKGDDDD